MENKMPRRYYLTYLYCLGPNIIAWLIVLFIRVFKGGKIFWLRGLWCEIADKNWRGMTGGVVGHGGWYGSGKAGEPGVIDTEVEYHEHEHVYQYEVSCLRTVLTLIPANVVAHIHGYSGVMLVTSLVLWSFLGVLLWVGPGWIQAWMRGVPVYRQSVHERAAYSLAEDFAKKRLGID